MGSDWLILGILWELLDDNYISLSTVFILSWLISTVFRVILSWSNSTWCWRISTDIATEIYAHYKEMYLGGVKEMTAIDPSFLKKHEPLKQDGSRNFLNDFWNCSLTASCPLGPVSGNVQSPISHPQYSSTAKAHAAPSVSPKPPVPMPAEPPPPQAFLVARKNRSTGENPTDLQ